MRKENEIYLTQFLDNCKRQNRSQFTLRNYRSDLEKFIHWYEIRAGKKIEKANATTISDYKIFLTDGGVVQSKKPVILISIFFKIFEFLRVRKSKPKIIISQKPLGPGSQRRHLSTIKNFFEYLKQTHEDDGKKFLKNPVKSKVHGIKVKDVDINNTKLLSDGDWNLINETVYRIPERSLVYLLYYAGLRLNEVRLLRWKDINIGDHLITVQRKGGKIQTLRPMMSKKVFSQLRLWKDGEIFGENDYLFPGRKPGEALGHKAMFNLIIRILAKSGVNREVTPHSFRKGCATKLYRKTKDLIKVRDFLGHKDAQVTQTYIDSAALYKKAHTISVTH